MRSQRPEKVLCGHSLRSPALRGGLPKWRSNVVLFVVFCAFAGLLIRAITVQLIDRDFYAEQGRKRFSRVIEIPAARGDILDRTGRLLAISRPVRTIYAMPAAFETRLPDAKRAELAALLDMPQDVLATRLDSDRSFVYLKHRVPLARAAQIDALGIPEVRSSEAWQRYYPDGPASAQIIGFTDIDGHGLEGIEASLEDRLKPLAGRRTVIRNRLGEIVDNDIVDQPQAGDAVHLTIDARLQNVAFAALQKAVVENNAQAGGAVVIDARNGEILALANWPSFDPADRRARIGPQVRNRVVTDIFEPGSVIKPLHIAHALERGWVTPESIIDVSPGWIRLSRFTVRDVSPRGALSIGEILRYSSNVGMVRLMQRDTPEQMWSTLRDAGFGVAPSLPFPGAAAGKLRPVEHWSGIDQAALSYGYGISLSLLQLARAYTMFGPAGSALPLSLLREPGGMVAGDAVDAAYLVDATEVGQAAKPVVSDVAPLSARTTQQVRHMLEGVTQAGGTAHRARVDGFLVGAKTGTTRKMAGKGYAEREYVATTVGIAPVSLPRFVVAVMIDGPTGAVRGGGAVAAPVFSTIMSETLRLMHVLPDAG